MFVRLVATFSARPATTARTSTSALPLVVPPWLAPLNMAVPSAPPAADAPAMPIPYARE